MLIMVYTKYQGGRREEGEADCLGKQVRLWTEQSTREAAGIGQMG